MNKSKLRDDKNITGDWETRWVWIGNVELSPKRSQAIYNHSDEFNWSYGGSGPSQLALALLLELADESFARLWYQRFKWTIIANLPDRDFTLPIEKVLLWIKRVKADADTS